MTDAMDFGRSSQIKMASIQLFKMYAMDTPCESDIFRTVSPIDLKFQVLLHITYRTNAIDFRPPAKNKMAAIVI